MCNRCTELEDRIAELEEQLGLRMSLPATLYTHLSLTVNESYILAALFQGRRWMSRLELDEAVPIVQPSRLADKEFRTLNAISIHIHHIRRRFPGVVNVRRGCFGGYQLTDKGRALVQGAIDETRSGDCAAGSEAGAARTVLASNRGRAGADSRASRRAGVAAQDSHPDAL